MGAWREQCGKTNTTSDCRWQQRLVRCLAITFLKHMHGVARPAMKLLIGVSNMHGNQTLLLTTRTPLSC